MMTESKDLEALRENISKTLLAVLWLHLPVSLLISLLRGTDWLLPSVTVAVMAIAATISYRTAGHALSTRLVFAVALMSDVSVFTFQLAGHPWQADMHMYFFAALAGLVAYCDYRPILAATLTVALHHLVLNFVLPAAIYPGGSDFERFVLHVFILFIEAAVLIWLAQTLTKLFATAEQKTAEAEAANIAQAEANAARIEAEESVKRHGDVTRRDLAAGFEETVSNIVSAVAVAAGEMQSMSALIGGSSQETARQSEAAAAASDRASMNIETVAAATDQLTASIGNIASQVTRSTETADKAAEEARRTTTVVEGLAASTQKIGEVVTLIQNIASQTNLLALNATIEAARAGEHGKGFAVVASEVKALANQTAKATEEISAQVQDIQNATGEAVQAIQIIGGTIAEIDEISAQIAAAVNQQGAATQEIVGNVHQAAACTREVNDSIVSVTRASTEAGMASSKLLEAANGLSSQSAQLKSEVGQFLGSLHAA